MKVAVISSARTIGATTAYTLTLLDPDADVTLVDTQDDAARGPRNRHPDEPRPQFTSGRRDGTDRKRNHQAAGPSSEAVTDADCIVVAAGIPRPDDSAKRGGRLSFLERNRELVDESHRGWGGRTATHHHRDESARPHRPSDVASARMGPALLHRLRALRDRPSRRPSGPSRRCPPVRRHLLHDGTTRRTPRPALLPSRGPRPITLSPDERERISEAVKDVPDDIMSLHGSKETSRWVTPRRIASLVASTARRWSDEPVCCSVPLDGEYGYHDLSLSVPVRLSEDGVGEIVEWELSSVERTALDEAAEAVGELCR